MDRTAIFSELGSTRATMIVSERPGPDWDSSIDAPVRTSEARDAPAPPRLLPEFDSVLLAHQDRTRVVDDARRKALATKNLRVQAVFLVDGFVAGVWRVEGGRVVTEPFSPVPRPVRRELEDEAGLLGVFLAG